MPRGEQSSGNRVSFWGQGWGKHLNTVGLVVTALDLQRWQSESQEGCETSEDTHLPSVRDGPTVVFVSRRNTGVNPLGHLRGSCRTRARPAGTELARLLVQCRHLSADAVLISSLNSVSSGFFPAPNSLSPEKYDGRKGKSTLIIHLRKTDATLVICEGFWMASSPTVAIHS